MLLLIQTKPQGGAQYYKSTREGLCNFIQKIHKTLYGNIWVEVHINVQAEACVVCVYGLHKM